MAKRVKEPAPAGEIVKVEESSIEAAPEIESMPEAQREIESRPEAPAAASGPSFGQRVRGFLAFLLRLILLLIFLTALAIELYFALPLVYRQYILPVQQNTAQLRQLQTRQDQSEQELADLQARLDAIETEQAQRAQSLKELNGRVSEIEKEIAARTESLAALEQMQSALQAQNEVTNAEVERQVNLLKAMELLSRARLFMYQSNFGLARQDAQTARDLLARVQPDAPESLVDDLTAVILRLDLTLSNLPNFPVAASDDLDIAWQILLAGMPPVQETVSATPAPEVTVTVTPSGTLEPTATP